MENNQKGRQIMDNRDKFQSIMFIICMIAVILALIFLRVPKREMPIAYESKANPEIHYIYVN